MSPSNLSHHPDTAAAITIPANPQTLSKKIILKLKVNNQDLDDGKYRQTTPVRLTSRTKSTKKSISARQPSKRKPRNTSRIQQDEEADVTAKVQNLSCQQPKYPLLEDFKSVSEFSFPFLVSKSPNRTQTEGRMPQHQIRCAGCDIPAPPDLSMTIYQRRPMLLSNPNAGIVPAWQRPNLGSKRYINHDAHPVTDLIATRSGTRPNTLEFWYDVTIAEQAKASENVDFKMLCLNSISTRAKSDIPRLDRGGWDIILESAVARGKAWKKIRKWRERERSIVAALAVREETSLRMDQGEFVDQMGRGAWVLRRPGFDGVVRRVLTLGHRRADENANEELSRTRVMDVDRDESLGDAMRLDA